MYQLEMNFNKVTNFHFAALLVYHHLSWLKNCTLSYEGLNII